MLRTALVLFAASAFISGCSTMLNRGDQVVRIEAANQQTASIEISGLNDERVKAQLPVDVRLPRSTFKIPQIDVVDPCFEPQHTIVTKQISPSFLLNALNLFVYGTPVDLLTGSMWDYESEVKLDLVPISKSDSNCVPSLSTATPKISIVDIELKKKNRFALSFGGPISARNNKLTTELFNAYSLEWIRSLSPNAFMAVSSAVRSNEGGCNRSGNQYCELSYLGYYGTTGAFSVSLRSRMMENSGAYVGLGVASVITTYSIYHASPYDPGFSYGYSNLVSDTDYSNTGVVEVGWIGKSKGLSFYANFVGDLRDFRLVGNDAISVDHLSAPFREAAKEATKQGRSISGWRFGISYPF